LPDVTVNVSELKSEGKDVVEELLEFLRETTGTEVAKEGDDIIINEAASRSYVRVVLRRFLHRKMLRDYFRVLGGPEQSLIVKEKKTPED
jgi:hypothetical protein